MELNTQFFLDRLVSQDERLRIVYDSVLTEWSPTSPPLTILFGELGDRIAQDLEEDSIVLVEIFLLIEMAMNSRNEELVLSVATGMIEAMVTKSHKIGGIERLLNALGTSSRRHALAWIED